MLPVLKQAGVVDAGGKGFLTIIEGMLLGLKGKDAADYLIEEAVISSQKLYLKSKSCKLNRKILLINIVLN